MPSHRILEDFLNAALEGEMDSHLSETKSQDTSNRRNSKMRKNVQTEYGPVVVETMAIEINAIPS